MTRQTVRTLVRRILVLYLVLLGLAVVASRAQALTPHEAWSIAASNQARDCYSYRRNCKWPLAPAPSCAYTGVNRAFWTEFYCTGEFVFANPRIVCLDKQWLSPWGNLLRREWACRYY